MSRLVPLLALAALALAGPAPAQTEAPTAVTTVPASINIAPRRLVFDRGHHSGTVFLYNQGGAPATVDITLVDRVMLGDGQIVTTEDAAKTPEQKAVADKLSSAKAMLLVAPRRVTLEPGRGQTIRLRVGNVPDAPANTEFRTHLTVTTIPPRDTGVTAEAAAGASGSNKLSFRITAVYGLSIPVIVRTGETDVRAALENARIETQTISLDGRSAPKPTPVLLVDLVREGATSLYGNVEVRPAGVKSTDPIGLAHGVGVYPEIGRRALRIPLSRPPKAGEKFEVTFTDDDTSPGKVLAHSTL